MFRTSITGKNYSTLKAIKWVRAIRIINICEMNKQGNRIKLWPRQGFHEGNLVKSLHGIDVS